MGPFLLAGFLRRQPAHLYNSQTRSHFLRAIQDQSVFGHPLFERVLVCGKKRKEEITDWCLPCRKQLPRWKRLSEGERKAEETTQPRPLLWSLAGTHYFRNRFYTIEFRVLLRFENAEHSLQCTLHLARTLSVNDCFWKREDSRMYKVIASFKQIKLKFICLCSK